MDLEEQEQLDQLKHFWKQYGNATTWVLIVVFGGIASWNGYGYWQRSQATQAAAMFDEVERVARAGDFQKTERAFSDMKERFASTTYSQQAGLLVAKTAHDAGNIDAAKAALTWVADKSGDKGYASLARLRLAGLLLQAKEYEAALAALNGNISKEFAALAADRRGDIFAAQGNISAAKKEYEQAFQALDDKADYRRLVEVKLNAMGVVPAEAKQGTSDNTEKMDGSK